MTRPHTPDGRRIHVAYVGQQLTVQGPATEAEAARVLTFQDDVRVIGMQIADIIEIQDEDINVDGYMESTAQISGAGDLLNDVPLLQVMCKCLWHGIFFAGTLVDHINMMLPEGYGYDFDTGQSLYLVLSNRNGTGNLVACFAAGIIYWVER